MSPAKQQIWILSLFAKTVHGKNQFGDRLVEKFVGGTRIHLGKHVASNNTDRHYKRVREVSLLTNDYAKLRKFKKGSNRKQRVSFLKLGKKFLEGVLYLRDMNLFGEGPPLKIPPTPFAKRKPTSLYKKVAEYEFCGVGEDQSSNQQSCFLLSEGSSRWLAYIQKYIVDGDPNDASRTETGEDGVALPIISSAASNVQTDYEREKERCTNESYEYLKKRGVYTVEELDGELKAMESELGAVEWNEKVIGKFPSEQGKAPNKAIKVHRLIAARMRSREINPQWANERQEKLEEKHRLYIESNTQDVQQKLNDELSFGPHYFRPSPQCVHDFSFERHLFKKDTIDPYSQGSSTIDPYSVRSSQTSLWGYSQFHNHSSP
jgi:hypothetical protein